jgi:hypothetical protein
VDPIPLGGVRTRDLKFQNTDEEIQFEAYIESRIKFKILQFCHSLQQIPVSPSIPRNDYIIVRQSLCGMESLRSLGMKHTPL